MPKHRFKRKQWHGHRKQMIKKDQRQRMSMVLCLSCQMIIKKISQLIRSKNAKNVKGIALVTMRLQNPGPYPSILIAQVVLAAVEVPKVVLSIIK
ncbi:uncharacterized protein DS421_1g16750 [Arachis hypogaea]|nr:uncharacterized protein DS421_1g16750 [Arachis hypogaea]